jgi:hypothetical protein
VELISRYYLILRAINLVGNNENKTGKIIKEFYKFMFKKDRKEKE